MGKLGKKARKFAKKNLQSVLRNRRKTKVLFKKRAPKKGKNDVEKQPDNQILPNVRSTEFEGLESISLDAPFTEDDKSEVLGASDSDGYLSEDLGCPIVDEIESAKVYEDEAADNAFLEQNRKIDRDLAVQKKKLNRLRKKDPKFSKFLESYYSDVETFQREDLNSDEDLGDHGEQDDVDPTKVKGILLTNGVLNSWYQMLKEDNSQPALKSLLNAYRAACHHGAGSIGRRFENSGAFSNILLLMLSNADKIFQGLLFSSNSTKEMILDLKKASKWKSLRPLVKSFVRSTIFLLNQVNDAEILAFAMMRIRASLYLFVAFPSLMQRLIKATVNLWIAGGNVLSSASFLVMRDVAALSSATHFETCLSRSCLAFISRYTVAEIADIKQMHFLRDCIVELCSLDVQKSSIKASASIDQLAKVLSWGLLTKKKELVKKICSWEYVNCLDIWVRFISANIKDYDLQSLFYTAVQLVNGVAHMFSGPRYFPLRLKCIEWLNSLSSSSGTFIPLASLVLDVLEYKIVKEGRNEQSAIDVETILKLPKHYLKSRSFLDECFYSALNQLCVHFSQWSYHISFPELATIPLIRLRKIHDLTTVEGLRRAVKRFIDQAELNVDFVQRKRDEVPFSPHDHQSVNSFLQHEKSSLNTSFMQYYKSVMDKAVERSLPKQNIMSLPEKTKEKRSRTQNKQGSNGTIKN